MKIIYRHVGARIFYGYALTSAVFFTLFGLFEFMQRAEEIGVGRFSIVDAISVTLMAMPARVIDLSPFIAMLGVIYGLSLLVRDNELIALRTSGMTPLHLLMVCAVTSALFMTITLVAEFAARPLAQQAQLLFMQKTSKDGSMIDQSGVWTELEDGYLHIEVLSDNQTPEGIHWYEFYADGQLSFMRHAERAVINNNGTWSLQQVTEKRFPDLRADNPIPAQVRHRDALLWTPATLNSTSIYQIPLETFTLQELYIRMRQLQDMGKPAGRQALAFWQRCLLPFSVIIYTLFAAPFIIGIRPRASMGGIITLATGAALLLFLVQQLLADALHLVLQKGLLASGIPLLLILLPALWMINYIQRR